MAELADAADSKSAEGNLVGVRPPLPAPRYPAQHLRVTDQAIFSIEGRKHPTMPELTGLGFTRCTNACSFIKRVFGATRKLERSPEHSFLEDKLIHSVTARSPFESLLAP